MTKLVVALACTTMLLSACDSPQDKAEDKLEDTAKASAVASGGAIAALGLTEMQLLKADLIGPGGIELGDIAGVLKGRDGTVDRLLVEIEDSNPDRYVAVPVDGLTTVKQGNDIDLSTTMTKAQIDALPAEQLPPA